MKMLIVSCMSGMCNRMFAILGAIRLAEKMGRELRILWVRNGNLDVDMADIFESDIPCISQGDFCDLMAKPEVTTKIYNSGFWPHCECIHVAHDDPHDVVLVKPWYIPAFIDDRDDRITIPQIRAELGHLRFKHAHQLHIDYSNYVGIHIRYGDYNPSGVIEQTEMFSGSPVSRFKEVMAAIVASKPDTKFYVSCPMEFIKMELAHEFNIARFFVAPNRQLRGTVDAIKDLHNFSSCKLCIGTEISTFTKMVGVLSNKEVIIVHKASLTVEYGYSRPISIEDVVARA